jgi:hypothetical protein
MTADPKAGKDRAKTARKIWCAYSTDGSDFVIFGAELTALRYATEHGMLCKPVGFGVSLKDQLTHMMTKER